MNSAINADNASNVERCSLGTRAIPILEFYMLLDHSVDFQLNYQAYPHQLPVHLAAAEHVRLRHVDLDPGELVEQASPLAHDDV